MFGKPELIGVDVGQYSIKVVRLKSGKKPLVSKYAYELIPEELREKRDQQSIAMLVASAVKKSKASAGKPVMHVNAGDAIMNKIKLAEGYRSDALEGAIELELNSTLPFDVSQVYFDFDEKPNDEGLYLTVSVRRDVVDAKTSLLSGLPKSFKSADVDIDAYALSRVFYSLMPKETFNFSAPVMIVDVGFSRSRFYVFESGELVFNREQQIGGQQATSIISDMFDIDLEQAESKKLSHGFGDEYDEMVLAPFVQSFSEQLNLAIDFYDAASQSDTQLENIYLTGGGCKLVGLVDALNETSISQNVSLLTSLSSVMEEDASDYFLAMGLSIEGDK